MVAGALEQQILTPEGANASLGLEAEQRGWYEAAASFFAEVSPRLLARWGGPEAAHAFLETGDERLLAALLEEASQLTPKEAHDLCTLLLANRRLDQLDPLISVCAPEDRASVLAQRSSIERRSHLHEFSPGLMLALPTDAPHSTSTDDGAALIALSAALLLDRVRPDHPEMDGSHEAQDAWVIVAGEQAATVGGIIEIDPADGRLRPIVAGLSISDPLRLTDRVIDALRQVQPIGCTDWFTVDLLLNAGIDAFRSGSLAATLTADVLHTDDAPSTGPVSTTSDTEVGALVDAVDRLRRLASSSENAPLVDPDVASAVAAVGASFAIRPRPRGSERWDGLLDIGHDPSRHVERGVALANAVIETLRLALAGTEPARVYERWAQKWAHDVASARARLREPLAPVPPPFDVHATASTVREDRVEVGPRTHGETIDIALALDSNLVHQLPVTLEGVTRHASMGIRAWVLGRQLSADYLDWLRAAFPDVCFTFLPCEAADYGYASLLSHITESTMDRLLLPLLVPEVKRIVYIDIDALFIDDVAALHRLDLGEAVIAARPHGMGQASGLSALRGAARVLKPQMAAELRRRVLRGEPGSFPGWNAGVMVLDLERMRGDRFCEDYLGWSERYRFGDQRTLMFYSAGRFAPLHDRWNMWPMHEPVDQASVLHWIGPAKPWSDLAVPHADRWLECASAVRDRAGRPPA